MDKRRTTTDSDGKTVSVADEIPDLEIYSDDQIAQWVADDRLDDEERDRIADTLTPRS